MINKSIRALKKIASFALAIMMIFSCIVSASPLGQINFTNPLTNTEAPNEGTITGKTTPFPAEVTFMIINKSNGNIVCIEQFASSSANNGEFVFNFKVPSNLPEGIYTVRVGGQYVPEYIESNTIIKVDSEEKSELATVVNNALMLIDNTAVGTKLGNAKQEDKDNFQSIIDAAVIVLNDTNASQEEIEAQINAVNASMIAFENSLVTFDYNVDFYNGTQKTNILEEGNLYANVNVQAADYRNLNSLFGLLVLYDKKKVVDCTTVSWAGTTNEPINIETNKPIDFSVKNGSNLSEYELKFYLWDSKENISPLGTPALLNPPTVRVACMGDSITNGAGLKEAYTYPYKLSELLGSRFEVKNFGVIGATLLKNGDNAYVKRNEYSELKYYNPHIIIIMLGTNDTKSQNYQYIEQFESDYKSIIAELSMLSSKPKIILCTCIPVYGEGNYGINNENLVAGVIPRIKNVAKDLGLPLIDVNTAFLNSKNYSSDLYTDNVHIYAAGNDIIANAVYDAYFK